MKGAVDVESQALNGLVTGFSFAAAIAWMDVARWIISEFINVPKSSGSYAVMTALLTTVLAVLVYAVLSRISSVVKPPQQPIYAVH